MFVSNVYGVFSVVFNVDYSFDLTCCACAGTVSVCAPFFSILPYKIIYRSKISFHTFEAFCSSDVVLHKCSVEISCSLVTCRGEEGEKSHQGLDKVSTTRREEDGWSAPH